MSSLLGGVSCRGRIGASVGFRDALKDPDTRDKGSLGGLGLNHPSVQACARDRPYGSCVLGFHVGCARGECNLFW